MMEDQHGNSGKSRLKKAIGIAVLLAAIAVVGGTVAYYGFFRDSDGTFTLSPDFVSSQDVVVIGTELEGLYLAHRARQEGLKVLIMEPKLRLGGQLLQAEMLYLDGVYDDEGNPLMQGGVKDLFKQYENGQIRKKTQFAQYVHKLVQGIPLEKQVEIDTIEAEGGEVKAIRYTNRNGKLREVHPNYVVDNTDDAAVLRKLGATPLPGLESMYGSSEKNREYMSATYMMKFKGADWHRFYSEFWKMDKIERSSLYGPDTYVDSNIAYGFPPIASQYEFKNKDSLNLRGLNILNQGDGEILINALQVYDVDPSKPETVERGMRLAKEEMPFIRDHLRRTIVGFDKLELNGEPSYLYVREYNHYSMEYMLQATDLMSGRMFWDNVSIGGYFMDVQGSRSNREGLAIGRPDKYGIPLRSYVWTGADNVVTTGKLIGSSPVAYGSTRIQPNGTLAAESIGVLLAQLLRQGNQPGHSKSLKKVTEDDMRQLHDRMEQKYHVQLRPVKAIDKIANLTGDQRSELDHGRLTLLGGTTVARHLPFVRMQIDGQEKRFAGIKPLVIEGMPWVPLTQAFQMMNGGFVKYDAEKEMIQYTSNGQLQEEKAPAHIVNNFVMVELNKVASLLNYELVWDNSRSLASLTFRAGMRPDAASER
jgi:hypothetical protein